jgi:hypothetical protein
VFPKRKPKTKTTKKNSALAEYYQRAGIPKQPPRKKARDRERRQETALLKEVHREVSDRDGYCRLYWIDAIERRKVWDLFGECRGRSELAHYNETHRRSKTRGRAPEDRHDAAHALKLCERHHDDYDQNIFEIEERSASGCHGQLRVRRASDGAIYDEA